MRRSEKGKKPGELKGQLYLASSVVPGGTNCDIHLIVAASSGTDTEGRSGVAVTASTERGRVAAADSASSISRVGVAVIAVPPPRRGAWAGAGMSIAERGRREEKRRKED